MSSLSQRMSVVAHRPCLLAGCLRAECRLPAEANLGPARSQLAACVVLEKAEKYF